MTFTNKENRLLALLVKQELERFRAREGRGEASELPRVLAGEEQYEHFLEKLLAKLEGKRLKDGHK
ncbi:MAG: hypothetical protein QW559_03555 [Candidatus Woesearchaeota archaeon]